MSNPNVATGTPLVSVHDNRGLDVRVLNWNHNDSTDPLRLLVSHSQLDDASRMMSHRDPRLFAAWTADSTALANLQSTPSLVGQLLKRESTDSGEQVMLFDAAGRSVWNRDGRGTVQTVAYDELGRPVSGGEQLSGSEIRVSWRSDYGDSGPADDGSQNNNLRGMCMAQYDNGGLIEVNSVALSGAVLSQGQRFLASAEALPNWPKDEAGREALLEDDIYTTTSVADARGVMLKQTDAKGHVQAWRYDVSGTACRQTVTPAGGETQTLLADVKWSAAGQVLMESAGNGVTTTYGYDPQNQWLATITAQRGDNTTLQALTYAYDFSGNVTALSDGSVAVGYYRNQATNGTRQFTYDALYQLLSATGRENANNTAMQYSALPVMSDGSQYVNYTRSYHYDDSGNLSTLTHTGAGSFTRTMTTDTTSNRSVQQNDGGPQTPDEVANWFDANGNLLTLQASAAGSDGLVWDGSNNLQQVTLISRSSGDNDREIYQYSGSQRVRKQTRSLVNGDSKLWNIDEVRYLPGLELRKSWQETAGSSATPSLTEELHVVTSQAGRAGIRVLHWETGKPDGISNNQVRWSVDDNIGSLSLELDAEGQLISREEYYPFGGTAVWAARSEVEAEYKTVRYSGKERDGTGLYYYGHRYYAPWLCRWVSADPAGEVDGLNLFRMVRNNPVTSYDITGFITHKELEQRGIAAGIEIGKRLQQASMNPTLTLSAQTAAIKNMIHDFSQTLTDYKLPPQKTGQVQKAYNSAISGNKNDYAKQYRSANPDQDELISTQTVYSIFSGIGEHFKTAGITMTPDQESLVQAAFEFISLIRLPTKGSGYNLPGEVMQHPTSPKTLMFGSSGQNHGKADLERRNEAIEVLEKNLSAPAPAAVMKPLLDMAEHIAQYTLEEFTGPATAINMTPRITNMAERDEQTRGRDAMKHLSAIRLGQKSHRVNPIAATARKSAPWQRQKLPPNARHQRSFSPPRFA